MSPKPALKSDELAAGSAVRVVIDDVEVCVARAEDGSVHAVNDLCTHGEVSLSEGEVMGCSIECWLHGSTFDLTTGEPETPPAFEPVAVYAAEEQDGTIFVDIHQTH